MKNIIPFKKDIIFKTDIDEILSISLENTLALDNLRLSGDFIINGEYRINEETKPFDLKIPLDITIKEEYDTRNATIDIDDFYYEVKDNNVLFLSIDVLLDKLEEKEEPVREENIIEAVFTEPDFFKDNYVEYSIYILREGDTIDTILDKYNVTIDDLKDYNDIDNIKLGDKIIIPNLYERD